MSRVWDAVAARIPLDALVRVGRLDSEWITVDDRPHRWHRLVTAMRCEICGVSATARNAECAPEAPDA